MKILVIIESNSSKKDKIQTALDCLNDGNTYIIMATCGHLMDLPEKELGVAIDDNYKCNYVVYENKKDIIANLKSMKSKVDRVYLAPDVDFEGSYIGYSICKLLNLDYKTTPRLKFTDVAKSTIHNAIKNLTVLDDASLEAQMARRVIDRLIGYLISSMAYTINPKLTVGRVQTIMVKAVIDRELECEKFKSSFSFHVSANFHNITAKLNKIFDTEELATEFLTNCKTVNYSVVNIADRIAIRNPPIPLITTSLQAKVASRIGISPKAVIDIAQALYSKGVISYPRTDCPKMPEDKLEMCQDYIIDNFGKEYHHKRQFESNKIGDQEAHSCIYPTDITVKDLNIAEFTAIEQKVYKLVWLHTVCSQMSASQFKITKIKIAISNSTSLFFEADTSKLMFDGYLKVWNNNISESEKLDDDEDDDNSNNSAILKITKLPHQLKCSDITATQKISQGPQPYTQSKLLDKLDLHSIGRPSTRGKIMAEVIEKGFLYITTKAGESANIKILKLIDTEIVQKTQTIILGSYKDRIYSTELGRAINNFVNTYFSEIFNYAYTENLQLEMDKIALGETTYYDVVHKLYKTIEPNLAKFPKWHKTNNNIEPNPAKKPKRLLGQYNLQNVYALLSKNGAVLQVGEFDSDYRFVDLPNNYILDKISLEDVIPLLQFPKDIGTINGKTVKLLRNSKTGLYISIEGDKTYSIKPEMFINYNDKLDIIKQIDNLQLNLIENHIKTMATNTKILKEIEDIKIIDGKYGPYFNYNLTNIPLKNIDITTIATKQQLIDIYTAHKPISKTYKSKAIPQKKEVAKKPKIVIKKKTTTDKSKIVLKLTKKSS